MDSFGVPADGEYSSESETECHGKEARVLYSKVEDAKVSYLRGSRGTDLSDVKFSIVTDTLHSN